MPYIYKITNSINNKIYIGQTTSTLKLRFNEHKSAAKNNTNTYLYKAMRKYGFDNFTIEEIEYVEDIKDLDGREIFWINYYDSTNHNIGYNICAGGIGHRLRTQKEINKMLELWDEGLSQEQIEDDLKISRGSVRKYLLSNGISDEDLFKRKNEKMALSKRKIEPVMQYDLNKKYIKTFNSAYDAIDELNLATPAYNIYSACMSDSGFSNGYLWRYKDNYVDFKSDPLMKRILKIDKESKCILQIYNNIKEAANDVGVHPSVISRICNRSRNKHTAKGFIWRFEDDCEFINEDIICEKLLA